MTDASTLIASNFHALLIGIDCYLPNKLSGIAPPKTLQGCVRDINHVEAFLKNALKIPESQILKLTASNAKGSKEPTEPQEQLPTYENIVAKFNELIEKAQPQDRVYIHYSGHGGRATTIYPHIKGENGVDETLVPTDIGNLEGRYVRDIELAFILRKMVDKGLVVTVVLDSCHSGGATRKIGDESGIRGAQMGIIDTIPRPTDSLVAPAEQLIETWKTLTEGNNNTRNIISSGWLPEPKGYTLFAACRDDESAYERIFEGNEKNGALTYWLLDSLKKLRTEVSAKVIHDRILAKIHSVEERQTPMLQGDIERSFFGSNFAVSQLTVPVMQVDGAKNWVQLHAGQVHGLSKGSEFAIYSLGTADLTEVEKRLALVKITQLGAVNSWATITQLLGESSIEDIEDGAPALLLYPSVKLVRKVRLLLPEATDKPPAVDQEVALQAIESSMPESKGWVELVSGDEVADYLVSVNAAGEYEILTQTGTPIANLRPTLKATDPNAAVNLVKRLVHLSKYHSTLDLENQDSASPLKGKIKVELCALPEDYEPGDKEELLPFNTPGNIPTLDVDRFAVLRIRNESFQTLNIAVLAIQPDWSIKKGYPSGAAFQPLDKGGEIKWRIKTSLPAGYEEGADILKVFATVDGTSFDWLELPVLDKPIAGKDAKKATTNLGKFLAAFFASDGAPPRKNVNSAAHASEEWTTEQVKLIVKRGASHL
ncbi:caspase family protein [Microcoleus sp. K5-D4]|uniref:caspase family protein n=1 Tax=Microcoleus sp. K5-D4 TaxID=2818801 RepID=UPI002FD058FD